MHKHINILVPSDKCCGCESCMSKCPKQCICMQQDAKGFYQPVVDESTCVDCGLCATVCPVVNHGNEHKPLETYAVQNVSDATRAISSSGGVFFLLAKQTIEQGGVVFGVRFDKIFNTEFCCVDSLESIHLLMGSKYVQAV